MRSRTCRPAPPSAEVKTWQTTIFFGMEADANIARAEAEEIKRDPNLARAYLRLAIAVFLLAYKDLSESNSSRRQDAYQFLRSEPDSNSMFAHWFGYLAPHVPLARVRELAEILWTNPQELVRYGSVIGNLNYQQAIKAGRQQLEAIA